MTSEWKTLLVSELADEGNRSISSGPFGSNLVSKDYTESGIPVIRGGNMSDGRWVGSDFAWVSEEKAAELSANLAFPGDIVFTQRGTLGQVCLVPDAPYEKYVFAKSNETAGKPNYMRSTIYALPVQIACSASIC